MNTNALRDRASRAVCIKAKYGCMLSLELRDAADKVDVLRDALSGLMDWCIEGCPDGGAYALIEARAAMANIEPRVAKLKAASGEG